MSKIYGVKDRWHPHINGNNTPEVRSDDPCFDSIDNFFDWCRQHGGDNEWYNIITKHDEKEGCCNCNETVNVEGYCRNEYCAYYKHLQSCPAGLVIGRNTTCDCGGVHKHGDGRI